MWNSIPNDKKQAIMRSAVGWAHRHRSSLKDERMVGLVFYIEI
jgi:hypothetical protein